MEATSEKEQSKQKQPKQTKWLSKTAIALCLQPCCTGHVLDKGAKPNGSATWTGGMALQSLQSISEPHILAYPEEVKDQPSTFELTDKTRGK